MAGSDSLNNYTLGRGELHFAMFIKGTQTPAGERYLGNSPELSYNASEEKLDHYSSDTPVRTKDASVSLQQDYAGAMTVDNISKANLAMFLLGEVKTITTASREVAAEALGPAAPGLSFQLGMSAADPAGVRQASALVLTNTTVPADVPVIAVDYVFDPVRARIQILDGSTKIKVGTMLAAKYTVDASTRDQVSSQASSIEGALRYLAMNQRGEQIDFYMPYVRLTPNGDFDVKGDEWQVLPFTIEIIKKGALSAIYADGQPYTPVGA